MKAVKRLIVFIFIGVLMLSNCFNIYAFNRSEHNKYMGNVLFKNFKVVDNDTSSQKKLEALEYASYLTIDQYNGNGENDLNQLKEFEVKGIISSISEIDYSAGANHRRYTHRGWDAEIEGVYNPTDCDRWIIRKNILEKTVDSIFNSKANKRKQNSFCALIYYTHILGDRIADNKYYPNAEIMELGGRPDKKDITHELMNHIEILFLDQKGSFKYNHVISKLNYYNTQISELLKNNNGNLTDENFKKYKAYAEGIMEVLEQNIPEMLKEEKFFHDAFY